MLPRILEGLNELIYKNVYYKVRSKPFMYGSKSPILSTPLSISASAVHQVHTDDVSLLLKHLCWQPFA